MLAGDEAFYANSHQTRDQKHSDQLFDLLQHQSDELMVQENMLGAHPVLFV